jgi:hypothetical protein
VAVPARGSGWVLCIRRCVQAVVCERYSELSVRLAEARGAKYRGTAEMYKVHVCVKKSN